MLFGLFKTPNEPIKGPVVDLVEDFRVDEKLAYDGVPTVYYYIYKDGERVGTIDLRLTNDGDNYYYGHVGYRIKTNHRGHHYAYEACKVLFNVAYQEFKMKELIITCSPDNIASYKTLQKLNGELIEIVDVPQDHELYKRGETKKCVFKYVLGDLC